jgi:flagellar hook-associated protein 1 FlgK
MTLSAALDAATSGLAATSSQISVVSRNIANQGNANASRKIANLATVHGFATVTSISRVSSDAVLSSLLNANSEKAEQSAISEALTQIQSTLGTSTDNSTSPVALLGAFQDALQTYSTSPENVAAAQTTVAAAQNLSNGLNSASTTVQSVRAQADSNIDISVKKINNLLGQIDKVNTTIVKGTLTGADVTDQLDKRDAYLQQLSDEIGITIIPRANNDIAIYTDSGVTLFDKSPRSVTFQATAIYGANTTGNAVYADGVPITAQGSSLSIQSGALVGYVKVRDSLAVTYQSQLDEIARGLITAFQETDQAGVGAPDAAGLFTDSGSTVPPAAVTLSPGLAARLQLAALSSSTQVRDGGIAGSDYVYNTNGDSGYSKRLTELISNISQTQQFDASAGAGTQATLSNYASASVSWLGAQVNQASAAASYSTAVQASASTALSNATGVNLDTEMSNMLALEQSYQASAKLITSIEAMYSALFAAIR